MRYKEHEIPVEQMASHSSDGMLFITAIMGTIIGILLVVLGRWGKQMWMWVWGAGLVLISFYMGISIRYDVTLFGYF